MTDKELKALKEAFDFPEPDRKDEFIAEFSRLSDNRDKKHMLPIVMRFAAAAAMFAVIIGVLTHMPKDTTDFGSGNDGIVSATETTTETVSTAPTAAVTTTVTAEEAVKTEKTTTSKVTGSAVTTAKTVTAEKTTAANKTTASSATAAPKTTALHTTTAHITVRTTSRTTETTQKPVTTTTPPIPADIDIPHAANKGENHDMTVSPDIIYPLRDKTLTEDQLYPQDGAVQQGAATGKPKDEISVLEQMYNDSSAVILANVDEMVYTSIDGCAVTAENISVISSYKGELTEKDMITVFFSGGYVPAEKYMETHGDAYISSPEEYSIYEKGESRSTQDKGKQYIFFIRKGGDDLPDGAYSPVSSGNTAVFRKVRNNYVSVDDANIRFTEAQLSELG